MMTDLELFEKLIELLSGLSVTDDVRSAVAMRWRAAHDEERRAALSRGEFTADTQAPVNDCGRVIGEHHHSAKLSNADVDQVHSLRAQGLSYGAIAAKFDADLRVSKSTVAAICTHKRRAHTTMGHRRVAPRYRPTVAHFDDFESVHT